MPQPVWMTALPDAGLLGPREPQAAGPCPAGPSARASGCPHRTEWLSSLYVGGTDGALTSLPPPRVAWGRGPPGPPDAPSSPAAGRSVGAHRTLCDCACSNTSSHSLLGTKQNRILSPLHARGDRGSRQPGAPRDPQGPVTGARGFSAGHVSVLRLPSGPCSASTEGASRASHLLLRGARRLEGRRRLRPSPRFRGLTRAGPPSSRGQEGRWLQGPLGRQREASSDPQPDPGGPASLPRPPTGACTGGGGCTGASNLFLHSLTLTLSLRRRERASVPGA